METPTWKKTIRIEHWGYAQTQGKIAAKNMVHGNKYKCENIPFFWSFMYGKRITYAGHALEYQRVILDTAGDTINYEKPKFAAFFINNGIVAAVCAMDRETSSQVAEILNAGVEIHEAHLDEVINNTKSSDDLIKEILEKLNNQ